jgi:hypothetical protein
VSQEREQVEAAQLILSGHQGTHRNGLGEWLCWECEEPWPCPTKVVLARLDTAETQRDTLRTALIEAQSELERWGHGDFHYGNMPRDPGVLAALARIREALEGTA